MSTQPDTTRQAFEAWAKTEEKLSLAKSNLPRPARHYTQIDTEWAFSGWQAATEHAARVCERLGPDLTNAQCADAVRRGSV